MTIVPGDVLANVRAADVWAWRFNIAKLGKPVDKDEWLITPQTVNAYYFPGTNEITFPAAILQAPFFDPNADDAVNYGGIGSVIGHEIGHGFDDQGRLYDSTGTLKDWWTKADGDAFTTRSAGLVAQYGAYEALPGLKVNGQLTLGENIGDLGGLGVAYQAYRRSLGGKTAPVIDGFTGDQRFFLAFAQAWRTKYARRGTALADAVQSARAGADPGQRRRAQRGRLVHGVQHPARRPAVSGAGPAREDLAVGELPPAAGSTT